MELVAAGGLVEELRAVKDREELEAMRAAAQIADAAYEDVRERGLAGRTEREVALSVVRFMEDQRRRGAVVPADRGRGRERRAAARGAARRGDPGRHARGDRLGRALDGYCSDCTRTFATGPLPDEALEVYELVRRAQAEASSPPCAPGRSCREVDAVARDDHRGGRPRRALRPRPRPRRGPRGARGAAAGPHRRGLARGRQRGDGRARRLPARGASACGSRIWWWWARTARENLTPFPKELVTAG